MGSRALVVAATPRAKWVARISSAWSRATVHMAISVLKTGQYLIDAKRALAHGEFMSMIESDLPFTDRTARMLMKITRDQRIAEMASNRNHGSILPPSWRTLYELTRLDDQEFQEFAYGRMSSDTERSDVTEFKRLKMRRKYAVEVSDGDTVDDLNTLARSGQKFGAIYADPPWTFEVYSGKGKARSAERHYDTMGLDDISALPVEALSAENCALFLWGVWPELPGALKVIKRWGFEYKTAAFVWVKTNRSGEGLFTGMGYWTRANSEPCLLATRGSPTRFAMDVHQVIVSSVGEHSEKPRETRDRIERLVQGPYLELFARERVEGWTTWGNQLARQEAAE